MTFHIITGNCLEVLRELEAESVHCVTTSPPYWGLRDYGIPPSVWGGDAKCDHEWSCESVVQTSDSPPSSSSTLKGNGHAGGGPKLHRERDSSVQNSCLRCAAWRGNFGLEPTPDLFIDHIVLIFEEVRRVLRKDGTLWLNLGDSYATGAGKVGEHPGGGEQGARWKGEEPNRIRDQKRGYRGDRLANGPEDEVQRSKTRADRDGSHAGKHTAMAALGPMTQPNRMPQIGLKPKDLVGIPWMAAFALRKAGWWLRSDVIWHKPNPMPESTDDRPTKSHEYLFLLTKSEHYFYDAEAIKEDASDNSHPRKANGAAAPMVSPKSVEHGLGIKANESFHAAGGDLVSKRNKRSVWTVATQPFAEAHFATFPPALIEPCILAGTSERGCCPTCMMGWERITAPTARYAALLGRGYNDHDDDEGAGVMQSRGVNRQNAMMEAGMTGKETETIGWYPSCKCAGMQKLPKYPRAPSTKGLDEATKETRLAPWRAECARITAERRVLCQAVEKFTTKRAVVLDPFGGAGMTALVADRLQRDSLIIELNAEYAEMARRRIMSDAPLFAIAAE